MTDNNFQLQLLEQIALSLQELVKLTRVMSYPAIRQILETNLDTDQKRLVYHFLDGTKTVQEIQKLAKVRTNYIIEWGQEWEKLGVVEPSSRVKGRRQKAFDLSLFGISVPEVVTDEVKDNSK